MADSIVSKDGNAGHSPGPASDEQLLLSPKSIESGDKPLPMDSNGGKRESDEQPSDSEGQHEMAGHLPMDSNGNKESTKREEPSDSEAQHKIVETQDHPMDSNGEESAKSEQPPDSKVQHGMMEIPQVLTPPSEEDSSMDVSPAAEEAEDISNLDSKEMTESSESGKVEELVLDPEAEVAIEELIQDLRNRSSKGEQTKTAEGSEQVSTRSNKMSFLKHVHHRNEKCDCFEIIDDGGLLNEHRPQTRSVEKLTEARRYAIKIDASEFARGDISVMIVNNKLSIYAKRSINTKYGDECHEFHKILKVPQDADIRNVAAELLDDGHLIVQLRRKKVRAI